MPDVIVGIPLSISNTPTHKSEPDVPVGDVYGHGRGCDGNGGSHGHDVGGNDNLNAEQWRGRYPQNNIMIRRIIVFRLQMLCMVLVFVLSLLFIIVAYVLEFMDVWEIPDEMMGISFLACITSICFLMTTRSRTTSQYAAYI